MTDAERAAARDQLVQHEGLRLRVYTDTVGKASIGVGRNLVDKGISKDEAFSLLDHDLDECEADLFAFGWYPVLDVVRRRAVRELRFILGPGKFRGFVKMLDCLSRDDFDGAANEIALSHLATQLQPSRLTTLVRQMRKGIA